MKLVVKTPLDLEEVAASRIIELDAGVRLIVKPGGLKGLLLVEECGDAELLRRRILDEVPEAESVLLVDEVVEADLDRIVEAAVRLARERIGGDESFYKSIKSVYEIMILNRPPPLT